MAVDNIFEPDHADCILAAGRADIVALGRPRISSIPSGRYEPLPNSGYRGVDVPPQYRNGMAQLAAGNFEREANAQALLRDRAQQVSVAMAAPPFRLASMTFRVRAQSVTGSANTPPASNPEAQQMTPLTGNCLRASRVTSNPPQSAVRYCSRNPSAERFRSKASIDPDWQWINIVDDIDPRVARRPLLGGQNRVMFHEKVHFSKRAAAKPAMVHRPFCTTGWLIGS